MAVEADPVCTGFEYIGSGQFGALPGPAARHKFGIKSSRTMAAFTGNPVFQKPACCFIETCRVTSETARLRYMYPVFFDLFEFGSHPFERPKFKLEPARHMSRIGTQMAAKAEA